MKKLLLPFLLFCAAFASAQTGSYSLTRYNGVYAPIEDSIGTIPTTVISREDSVQTSIPIGFTFSYCGTNYTTLSANTNGWISLANSGVWAWPSFDNSSPVTLPPTPYTPPSGLSTIGAGVGLIMPFWDDLRGIGSIAYYRTSGVTPNRVFTFQWGSLASRWLSYIGTGTATFQVRLFETSGVIEFCYGPSSYSGKTATIGICNAPTDYRTLTSAYATTVATPPTFYNDLDTTPAPNTILEWAPPCPSPPAASTGTSTVCVGASTTLSNSTIGGMWLSSSVSVASVGSGTGIVNGLAAGVVNITYRVSPGCFAITAVTVNPIPDTIAGGPNACEGQTRLYTNTTVGGTWSSSNLAVGTISSTGTLDALSGGTTTVSYTLATGCTRTLEVTVNPTPEITGARVACIDDTTVLTSSVTGGTWSSSNVARATVDVFGNVEGVTLGAFVITYTAPTGCRDTFAMAVVVDCDTYVGTVNGSSSKINVYPHPTNGDFYLSLPVSGQCAVTISDIYGKTLVSRQVSVNRSEQIKISESGYLASGNYILKAVVSGQTYISKLTVIK